MLPAEVVRGWCFTAPCRAWPGLWSAARPVFASSGESGLMFCLRLGAVLRSRSVIKSQVSRVKIRSARARFGFHCAAARTRLTRREPPVGDGELPAGASGLVVGPASDLAEGGVGDVPFHRSTRCRTVSVQAGTPRGENLGDIAN